MLRSLKSDCLEDLYSVRVKFTKRVTGWKTSFCIVCVSSSLQWLTGRLFCTVYVSNSPKSNWLEDYRSVQCACQVHYRVTGLKTFFFIAYVLNLLQCAVYVNWPDEASFCCDRVIKCHRRINSSARVTHLVRHVIWWGWMNLTGGLYPVIDILSIEFSAAYEWQRLNVK